jgi:hypothetical protein
MSESESEGSTEALPQVPPIPSQRNFEGRQNFETPTWIGPGRPGAVQHVPAQAEPEHDMFAPVPVPTRDVAILAEGHWSERAKPRLVAGTLLTLALLGAAGCLVLTILTQSIGAIAGLAGCAIVAVIFRGGLMSTGVMTVELKGSTLKVRRDGVTDIFNLADPAHQATLTGTPGDPTWRLRLEALGGRVVELTPAQVDPAELGPVVAHFNAIAARERQERERRFNR